MLAYWIGEIGTARRVVKVRSKLWYSWRLPVESVDFLAADIAHQQRSIIGRQACPRAEFAPKSPYPFQAEEPFQLMIRNPHALEGGIFAERSIEIEVFTVL